MQDHTLHTPDGHQDETQDFDKIKSAFDSETFIRNVCLSYRHDFGLLDKDSKQALIFECKLWMRAIVNNLPYFK